MIICGTTFLGFKYYMCSICHLVKKVCFTCKCRFCTSCGRVATENWIRKNNACIPDTTWQHVTFTMPMQFWKLFWLNRHLFNLIAPIPAQIIKEYCGKKGCIPGIFIAIHTFGRDLKRNFHIHLSTTCGGISNDLSSWIMVYFHSKTIMKKWRKYVVAALKAEYEKGTLKLPPNMAHIKKSRQFNAWINKFIRKSWMVYFQKKTSNKKRNIKYLGQYLKRPPLSEARIIKYDGYKVTFTYFDHKTKKTKPKTMPVMLFIGSLVIHIPDKHFRCIRYYGFLSNRTRGELLTIVNNILGNNILPTPRSITWQELQKKEFNHDPLKCPECQEQLCLVGVTFPEKSLNLIAKHQEIATKSISGLEAA